MNLRSRKIKPPHPDEQPQIIQYITDSPKNTILCEGNNSEKTVGLLVKNQMQRKE